MHTPVTAASSGKLSWCSS